MCEFCRLKQNGIGYSEIAADKQSNDQKGTVMALMRNNHNEIKDSHEVNSNDGKMRSYIKAWHWEFGHLERANHVAVEINFCPFCGDKL